ncbi:MAG: hypothetical protein LBR29_02635 [Methylobacteriaceae bacterium]|jgi:hypothetical protein|nr:hypothetical protein [Methylobacteriaceae bacterium]
MMDCVLKNKRHETFCWLLAGGTMGPVDALRQAGYKGGLGWLWRLLNREDIGRRLQEIGGLLRRLMIVPLKAAADAAADTARAALVTTRQLLTGKERREPRVQPAGESEPPAAPAPAPPVAPEVSAQVPEACAASPEESEVTPGMVAGVSVAAAEYLLRTKREFEDAAAGLAKHPENPAPYEEQLRQAETNLRRAEDEARRIIAEAKKRRAALSAKYSCG